jgi:Fe-S oxidoreductase
MLALGILAAAWRARLWARGRAAAVDVAGGLLAMPRRYLVDVHEVVARDRYAANMHVPTAGGFVAALVLVVLVHGFGVRTSVLVWALWLALAVMLVGTGAVAWRRLRGAPPRLSRGGFDRLPASLALFVVGFAGATLLASGVAWAGPWSVAMAVVAIVIALALAELVVGPGLGGPMKHALAGALHLAFHPRPERFAGTAGATALKPLDLDAAKLGVERPSDFAWNELLGFDACVQCGRCEVACPAFAAGQPLNPKKLVQDLVVGLSGPGSDAGYRGNGHPGRQPGDASGGPDLPIVPQLIHADTIWACTTCRACVDACPMMIEHVDAIIDIRRFLTLERGETPGKAVELIDELRATGNAGGQHPSRRLDWAADLALPVLADKGSAEVLLWLGDAAFDVRNQRTLRALVSLLRAAGVDFAVLGADEWDCGHFARRLGDEATFQELARHNIASLARFRFGRIVTADPHALHCLKGEYRPFGGDYTVVHHTTFLAELLRTGRLRIKAPSAIAVSYHDPCYLGRYSGEFEGPRAVLGAIGADHREMKRSRRNARCCGAGGGAAIVDVPGRARIPDQRMADVNETGAAIVAVACPNCAIMLEGVVAPRLEVRDVAELLWAAVVG